MPSRGHNYAEFNFESEFYKVLWRNRLQQRLSIRIRRVRPTTAVPCPFWGNPRVECEKLELEISHVFARKMPDSALWLSRADALLISSSTKTATRFPNLKPTLCRWRYCRNWRFHAANVHREWHHRFPWLACPRQVSNHVGYNPVPWQRP